ncbi:MAG: sulfite exporter TauE/SafE family protein, partial [Alphaproteobacteria bacterium]|nr:sulfite exporter TauE/SafE family protein [Alphaproteobacteria bacterium]
CAGAFATAGIVGAWSGAALGKALDGQRLLALFGLVMIAVGAAMLLPRRGGEAPDVRLSAASARRLLPRLLGAGLATGTASGFFGIGGGFLIVPALVAATGMPLVQAIGTSLVAVTAFGAATAASYALSGLVDWPVAGLMALGGLAGSLAGARLSARLAGRKRALSLVFAAVVMSVGAAVAWRAALSG